MNEMSEVDIQNGLTISQNGLTISQNDLDKNDFEWLKRK